MDALPFGILWMQALPSTAVEHHDSKAAYQKQVEEYMAKSNAARAKVTKSLCFWWVLVVLSNGGSVALTETSNSPCMYDVATLSPRSCGSKAL